MFRPNLDALLLRKLAKRTIHGKDRFAPATGIKVAVVTLADHVEETSVRADSTASRGAAEQSVLQAKILVGPEIALSKGDVIQVLGRNVEVESVHPRLDTQGNLDHIEVGGNLKGDL